MIGEVCRLLAALAPDETKAALRHRDRGENGEALVVLKAAVDRLRGIYPDNRQDTREICYRIRLAAARQQRTANEELKRIMSESASRLANIPDDVVNTVRGEVGDIVGSLEPRTQAGRVPARHVEALYRDLAEQACERVAGRLKRVTAESVDRILGQVLADIWSAPYGVLTAVDQYLAEKLPGEDVARRQMWSIVLAESDVRDMLDSALAGVDSAILLRETHFGEQSRAVEAILAKSGFSGLARTLLAFALRLIFRIAADDPGSLFSRDRLIAAVRRRVTDAMKEAVEGEDVRLALDLSVQMTQNELKAGQVDTAQDVDRIVQTLRNSEFETWLTTHVAEQRRIVDEASARLAAAQV